MKFRYPESKSEILVKTTVDNDFIIISIKDTGIGIDPANAEPIFSKYYRLENTIESSGIGLYLVKEVELRSGGKLVLESKLGQGSEFTIYLKKE